MQSHRQHARRRARTAQLAAGAGLAAALAIAVLPLHGALSRRAATNDTARPEANDDAQRPAPEPLDQAWVSRIFRSVGPEALPEQVAAKTDEPAAAVEPETPAVAAQEPDSAVVPDTRWQYLGSITTSRGRSALLRDKQAGNKQHLIAEGRVVEGFTVHRIEDAQVILTASGRQTKVELAPPSASWTAPGAAPPVRTAAATANQQRANSRVNPALANRARAGRTKGEIDPEFARQLREQVLHGEVDPDRIGAMQKAGMIDDATAAELVTQYKEIQGLSEEEYAELREKLK